MKTNNFATLCLEQFKKYKNKIAIKDKNTQITYQDLINEIQDYSQLILHKATSKNILILLDRSIELFKSIFSVLYADKTFILLNPNTPLAQIKDIININDIKTYISNKDYNLNITLVNVNEKSYVKVLTVDYSNKIFSIVSTSGSTGKPKCVKEGHSNVIDMILSLKNDFAKHFSNNVLQFLDLSFTFSYYESFATLFFGGCLNIIDDDKKSNIKILFDFINENDIQTLVLPTVFFNILTKFNMLSKIPNCVTSIHIAGNTIKITDADKSFFIQKNISLYNIYGTTETLNALVYKLDKNTNIDEFLPVGKSIRNIKCSVNKDGMLCVKSNLLLGYVNNCELMKNNAFLTNDIAKFNKNKDIIILGRKDNCVKVKGYKIQLESINSVVQQIESIENSQILYDKDNDKLICFFVGEISALELQNYIKEKLPTYALPILVKLNKLPTLKSGKINSIKLLKDYSNKIYNIKNKDNYFERIKLVLVENLKIDENLIYPNSTFEELGIDSLGYLFLIGNIEKEFKISLNENLNKENVKNLNDLIKIVEKKL